MSPTGSEHRLWWWIGGGVAALALLVAGVLPGGYRTKPSPSPPVASPPTQVVITPIDKRTEVGEQATLFDPKPLFLPTEWNTYEHPLPKEVMRQSGEVFRNFEPQLWPYRQTELALPAAETKPLAVAKRPMDLIKSPIRQPFIGFGREDIPIPLRAVRKGHLEVIDMVTGKVLITQNLGENAAPPSDRDWQPVEYLLTVDRTGLLGRPVVTVSSQVEAVDAYFRDYLARSLHLGERLMPGFYRVIVGP